jgi:hypothetical protein
MLMASPNVTLATSFRGIPVQSLRGVLERIVGAGDGMAGSRDAFPRLKVLQALNENSSTKVTPSPAGEGVVFILMANPLGWRKMTG